MYELREAKPALDIPKSKKIFIDGIERGTVEPTIIRDEVRWHASISLTDPLEGVGAGLAQGFGPTPDAAIVDAIASARRCRDRFASALAAVEQSLQRPGVAK